MKIINIGVLAHVDAGKTTLTESLLYNSGAITELGSVDKGTTRTDNTLLERQRGITIQTGIVQRRINGRLTVLSRSYNLYSDVQRADDIVVVLPAEAGEKHFGFEERVKLVNPRITAEGYKIGTRGFTNYLLHADDMIKE
ncbi:hypothetical protein EfmJHP36_29090 [Enterococcus faecium]|nr:hypothetical protein EfmJHP36_29090 [Enterococcus faecium]